MAVLKNAKDEKFVQELIKGKSQRVAYRESHENSKEWKDNSVDTEAWKLINKPEVLQRYLELLNKMEDKAIIDATKRKEELTNWFYDSSKKEESRLKALDMLNKMDGEYIEKVKLSNDEDKPFEVNINVVK